MFTDETHTWTRIRSENAMRHTEQVEIMSVKRRGRGSGEKKQNKNKRDREREREKERERERERKRERRNGGERKETERGKENKRTTEYALCTMLLRPVIDPGASIGAGVEEHPCHRLVWVQPERSRLDALEIERQVDTDHVSVEIVQDPPHHILRQVSD
jgi:hypothetical protein